MNLKDLLKVASVVIVGLSINYFASDTGINQCWFPVAAAVLGGGLSYLGSRKSAKAAESAARDMPEPIDIFARPYNTVKGKKVYGKSLAQQQAEGMLGYYRQNIPGFIGLQNKFGPQLMNQMFRQSNQFLDKQSALELRAAQQAARNVAQIRAGELGTMREQAPLTRGLMEGLSPEQAAVVQASSQEAARASASAKGVTPEEQRMYQQAAREASQASGRTGGSSAIAAEVMGREGMMAAKRAEAARAGQLAYSQAGEFYTTPGLNLLSNAPLAYKLGTSGAASAMSGGPAASGNFDFNMPLNLAQQSAGAENQYRQAVYQTNLANQQAKAQMWSSIGSSMMGAGLGAMGGVSGGNFSSFLGGGNFGNAGTAFGNMGREAMGMPLRAYTV